MKLPDIHKGRGALSNPEGRFERHRILVEEDGWGRSSQEEDGLPPIKTEVRPDPSRTLISHNDSPDIPFSQSINPYKGCGWLHLLLCATHTWLPESVVGPRF